MYEHYIKNKSHQAAYKGLSPHQQIYDIVPPCFDGDGKNSMLLSVSLLKGISDESASCVNHTSIIA